MANQPTMTGPNNLPTAPVPWRWMKNRPVRMTRVSGIT